MLFNEKLNLEAHTGFFTAKSHNKKCSGTVQLRISFILLPSPPVQWNLTPSTIVKTNWPIKKKRINLLTKQPTKYSCLYCVEKKSIASNQTEWWTVLWLFGLKLYTSGMPNNCFSRLPNSIRSDTVKKPKKEAFPKLPTTNRKEINKCLEKMIGCTGIMRFSK